MKFSDIQNSSDQELKSQLKTANAGLFQLKMKHSMGQLANPIEIRDLRRQVAKIKTALSQKKNS